MRDVLAAATSLMHATDEQLRLIARRDPDRARDVAAALISRIGLSDPAPGCGAADCVNSCDGGHPYAECPNVIRLARMARALSSETPVPVCEQREQSASTQDDPK